MKLYEMANSFSLLPNSLFIAVKRAIERNTHNEMGERQLFALHECVQLRENGVNVFHL